MTIYLRSYMNTKKTIAQQLYISEIIYYFKFALTNRWCVHNAT